MTIEEKDASGTSSYRGTTYYFCSSSCKEKFEKDPASYAAEAGQRKKHEAGSCPTCGRPLFPDEPHSHAEVREYTCPMHPEVRQPGPGSCPTCGMALEPVAPAAAVAKTEWTCPMHPEIVRDAPGTCPICGMALEPRTISLGEEENPELTDMTRRFRIGAALTVPLVYIAMGGLIPVIAPERFVPMRLLKWLELLLATPVRKSTVSAAAKRTTVAEA
jgi:P-type Cu+ transporter